MSRKYGLFSLIFGLTGFFLTVCISKIQAQKGNDEVQLQADFQKARVHFAPHVNGSSAQDYLQRFIPETTASRALQFHLQSVKKRRFSTVYTFRQVVNGLPVLDVSAVVDVPFSSDASVLVSENFISLNNVEIQPAFPGASVYFWSEPELLAAAEGVHKFNEDGISVLELVDDGGRVLMNRINGAGSGPATAVATVFNPNPITSAQTVYGAPYIDNNDSFNPALNAELDTVTLELTFDTSDSLYKLINDHVVITEHSPPAVPVTTSHNDTFFFVRSEPEFEDVNAFYHITEFWKYLEQIGYEEDVDKAVEVDANGLFGQDLSFFDVVNGTLRLTFGTGGVDDAEDADVIIHEYGHAVSYSLAPGSNQGVERQAIDEGFCDYLAASYSRNINPHDYRKVFNWDGHNEFWEGRVAWSNRFYPDQLEMRIYGDAPLWSGALVHVENNVGRDLTHQLVLESMYGYVPFLDMEQAARLILRADTLITGGDKIPYLTHIFAQRGFIETPAFAPPGDLVGIDIMQKDSKGTQKVRMMNSAGFTAGVAPVVFRVEGQNNIREIRVFSIGGEEIYRKICGNNQECTLSPAGFKSGLYPVVLELDDDSREVFKVVVL